MFTVTYNVIEHGLKTKKPQTLTKTFTTFEEQKDWELQQSGHPFLSLQPVTEIVMQLKVFGKSAGKSVGHLGSLTLGRDFNIKDIPSYFASVQEVLDKLDAQYGTRVLLDHILLETETYSLELKPI